MKAATCARYSSEGQREGLHRGPAVRISDRDRVRLMTVAAEPGREGLLDWLNLDVPDDRFVASALEVRRTHPKAKLLVVSGDFNVLNKARAARLAAFDPEEFFRAATTDYSAGGGDAWEA